MFAMIISGYDVLVNEHGHIAYYVYAESVHEDSGWTEFDPESRLVAIERRDKKGHLLERYEFDQLDEFIAKAPKLIDRWGRARYSVVQYDHGVYRTRLNSLRKIERLT